MPARLKATLAKLIASIRDAAHAERTNMRVRSLTTMLKEEQQCQLDLQHRIDSLGEHLVDSLERSAALKTALREAISIKMGTPSTKENHHAIDPGEVAADLQTERRSGVAQRQANAPSPRGRVFGEAPGDEQNDGAASKL